MATDLDENTITAEALRRLETTPDPRLREIIKALTRHLHDFAREVKLTEDEWMKGIQFLTAAGHMSTGSRQELILLSDTLGLSQLVVAQSHRRPEEVSEQTVLGPFHVEGAPQLPSHGAEITRGSVGDPLLVSARVVDADGKPVADAVVDVWHAGADGFYDVQDPAWKLDESRLRGVFHTDEDGRFSYWTILPLYYPIPTDGPVGEMIRATKRHPYRPAHIHYRITHAGFDPLVTHIFVDGDEYLDSDCVFGVRSSCIGHYPKHEAGTAAPDGSTQPTAFYTNESTFVLEREHAAKAAE
jgi:hydroxyquinol 1,2-dioxygenase